MLDRRTAKLLRAAVGARKLLLVFLVVAAVLTGIALSVSEPGRLYTAARFAWGCAALAGLALIAIDLASIWSWVRGRRGEDTD